MILSYQMDSFRREKFERDMKKIVREAKAERRIAFLRSLLYFVCAAALFSCATEDVSFVGSEIYNVLWVMFNLSVAMLWIWFGITQLAYAKKFSRMALCCDVYISQLYYLCVKFPGGFPVVDFLENSNVNGYKLEKWL
jgi:hypothetical protein